MAGLCNHTELGGVTVGPFRRPPPAIKSSCYSPSYLQRTPQACLHPSPFEILLLDIRHSLFPPPTPVRRSLSEDGFEISQFDIHYSFHPPSCSSLPRVSQATQASQGDEVAGAKQIGPEGARSERAQAVLLHRVLPRNTRQAAQRTVRPSLFFILLSCQKKLPSVSSVPSVANFFLSVNSCRFVAKKIN